METSVRHNPSFAVARITLGANEVCRAEAGAMMASAPDVAIAARAEGGFLKSMKRAALGGESFFVTSYTAGPNGGWVDVAARLPGDIHILDVDPSVSWFVQKGSWLASAEGVEIDTKWGGFKNMFGSEGGFILRASGLGQVVIGAYGAIEAWELAPGQQVTLDTGHMVAYQESVQMELRKATSGIIQSLKSGEGFVFDFTGPGKVLVQSRNPNEFLNFIGTAITPSGSSGGGGSAAESLIGGLFGRD